VNVLLAGFNLLPGFPLDGGRLLRACLWMLTREHGKATRWACWLGQILGGLGLALGLESLATGGLATGGWLGAVGAFLLFSARSSMPAARPAPRPAPAAVTSQRRGFSLWRSNS
jgi:Zn-dependent protease